MTNPNTSLNEALQTLNTRLAAVEALNLGDDASVLVNGKLENAMCLNFTDDDAAKPYATGIENARIFTRADRMGDNQSPLLKRRYFNGLQEQAMLYDASLVKAAAIKALKGAVELVEGMMQQQAA